MSHLSGYPQVFAGDTSVVDTTKRHPLGTRAVDPDGNEYIYLEGIGSTALYSVVTYDEAYLTALIAADAVGPVAVAMAAIVASSYGWYMIKGSTYAKCDSGVADNSALYINGTSGRVDDTDVAGDAIIGMWSRGTDSSNVVAVQLDYPKVHNIAVD